MRMNDTAKPQTTVGELKKILAHMSDYHQVIMENQNGSGYTPVLDFKSGHYTSSSSWTGIVLPPETTNLPDNSFILKALRLEGFGR